MCLVGALLAAGCGSAATSGAGSTTAPAEQPTTATVTTGSSATPATDTTTTSTTTPSTATTTAPSTTASTTPATTPPTTAPPTTVPPTTAPAGSSDVRAAQERLLALGYWLGSADGKVGNDTAHAVTAFQKVEGLKRTGSLDTTTLARLAAAQRPRARTGAGRAVEVDRGHQVLLAVEGGAVRWVFDISTGKPSTPTPAGTFRVTWQVDGIREAELGRLYRPKYFNDGIALHGYTSVPAYAASHGCVRLTYRAMDYVWAAGLAPIGTTVVVY